MKAAAAKALRLIHFVSRFKANVGRSGGYSRPGLMSEISEWGVVGGC